MFHLFTRKVQENPISPVILVREDFFLNAKDTENCKTVLNILRRDTIEFVEDNRLGWAVSEMCVPHMIDPTIQVYVRVKLTEAWDIQYQIGDWSTFNADEATSWLYDLRTELVF